MEGYRVEICEHAEEVLDISCRIYNVGHQNHIKEERRATTERHSVGDMTVLAVIKGVEGQNIKEQRAIMERKRVKVVVSTLCGIDLLHNLKNDEQYRNDLQGNISKLWLASSERFCGDDRHYGKYQKCRQHLIKMCQSPKSHENLHPDGDAAQVYCNLTRGAFLYIQIVSLQREKINALSKKIKKDTISSKFGGLCSML